MQNSPCDLVPELMASLVMPNISLNNENKFKIETQTTSENTIKSKKYKKSEFAIKHLREDVANKATMRKIRRRYHSLFKNTNKKLIRLRLVNLRNSQLIFGMRKSIKAIIPESEVTDDLILYLIGI